MRSQFGILLVALLVFPFAQHAVGDDVAAQSERFNRWINRLQSEDDALRLQAAFNFSSLELDRALATSSLIRAMANDDPFVRRHVVIALGEFGAPGNAAAALTKALRDPDIRVREVALAQLVRLGRPAVAHLVNALNDRGIVVDSTRIGKDGQTNVRLSDYATFALARIDAPVIPSLVKRYEKQLEEDAKIKKMAGIEREERGLQSMRKQLAAQPGDRMLQERMNAARRRLFELYEKHGDELSSSYLSRSIAFIVAERGSKDLQDLIHLLSHDNRQVRLLGLSLLTRLKSGAFPAVVPIVKRMVANKDDAAFLTACIEPLAVAGGSGTKAVIRLLNDHPSVDVRTAAARALGRRRADAVEALSKAVVTDNESAVRQAAAYSVMQIAKYEKSGPMYIQLTNAIPALVKALADPDPVVQRNAGAAVRLIVSNTPAEARKAMADEVVPLLVDALDRATGEAQASILSALGSLGEEAAPAIPTLLGALSDPPSIQLHPDGFLGFGGPRNHVVGTLGRIGTRRKDVERALLTLLRETGDVRLRTAAAKALGTVGSNESVASLRKILEESASRPIWEWSPAATALVEIGDDGIDALIEVMTDERRAFPVRRNACRALAEADASNDRIVGALIRTAKSANEEIRTAAAIGLAKRKQAPDVAIPRLIKALQSGGSSYELLEAIGTYGRDAAPALLAELTRNRRRREAADKSASVAAGIIELLGQTAIDSKPVQRDIVGRLKDPSPRVRAGAARALENLRDADAGMAVQPLLSLIQDELNNGAKIGELPLESTTAASGYVLPAMAFANGPEPDPAIAAFASLRDFGPRAKDGIPVLLQLSEHDVPAVRRNAILVLGRIGISESGVAERLVAALSDEHAKVRSAGAHASMEIGGRLDDLGPAFLDVAISDHLQAELDGFLNRVADWLRPSHFVSAKFSSQGLPPFPWPPPRYTHIGLFGRDFERSALGDDATTLGEIHKKLYQAMKSVDPRFESGLFSVPDGFAMLTKLERIRSDGTPMPAELRWTYGELPPLSLKDYVARLFFEKPGYFRVIAFVVTSQKNFGYSRSRLPSISKGGTELPDDLAAKTFKARRCYVLIYSFQRKRGGRTTFFDKLSATVHLKKAGILAAIPPSF